MKKLFNVLVVVLFMSLLIVPGFAAEPNATEGPNVFKTQVGSGTVITGPIRLHSINLYSDTAGDLIAIYDAADATGATDAARVYEAAIASNTSSVPHNFGGLKMQNLYVRAINESSVISASWSY